MTKVISRLLKVSLKNELGNFSYDAFYTVITRKLVYVTKINFAKVIKIFFSYVCREFGIL